MIASVPRAGYVVAWLSGPIGIFGGGLLVGLTLLIAFGRGTAPAPDGTPRGVSGVTAAALVLGLGVSMASVASHRDTLASWTDAGAATTGTLATGSYNLPAAPRITTCTKANGAQGNTIAWTAATNPTTFEVRYTGNAHAAQSVRGHPPDGRSSPRASTARPARSTWWRSPRAGTSPAVEPGELLGQRQRQGLHGRLSARSDTSAQQEVTLRRARSSTPRRGQRVPSSTSSRSTATGLVERVVLVAALGRLHAATGSPRCTRSRGSPRGWRRASRAATA